MNVNRPNERDYREPMAYNFGMEIGAKIKEFRTAAKLSQGKLAKAAGVSQAVISDLESGEQQTSRKLPEIAAALGRPLADFDPIYALPEIMAATGANDRPHGDSAISFAVHEAFTLAGFPDDDSTEIAATIQLIVTAHPPVPRGMSREDVVRRLVKWELGEMLRRQARPKSQK